MSRKFLLCYFETTRRCNLSCSHCMTRNGQAPQGAELTTDEAKYLVLDEIKKASPNGAVAFSGGEFLLRTDALELIRYNNQLGLYTFINTNGKGLNRDMLRALKSAAGERLTLGLSLDSIDDGLHQKTRSDRASETLELIKLCDQEQIGYFCLVTVTKANLTGLKATMDFLKSQGIPVIRSPFVPRGAGRDIRHLAFDKKDMETVIHPALKENHLSYVSFTPFFAGPEFMDRTWRQMDIPIANLGCQAGRGFIGVSAEGHVAPCVHLLDSPVQSGNVRNRPLSEIIAVDPVINSLKDGRHLKGKCGRCRYKNTCSGCRALAYYHSGDYLAEDPTCFFEPKDETTVSPFEADSNRNVSKFLDFIIYHKPWNRIFRPSSLWSRVKILSRLMATSRPQ